MVQSLLVSVDYFAYKSTTNVKIHHPTLLNPPVVSVCGYFQPIMYDEIVARFDHDSTNINEMQVNISLNDVFRLAPRHNDFLLSCVVFMTNGTFVRRAGHDCNQIFNFTRYFMQHELCYMFEYKLGGVYDFESVAREAEGAVYALVFNTSTFTNLTYFRVIMHELGSPLQSRFYANYVPGPGALDGPGSTYEFTYEIIEHKLLPAPYDTKCVLEWKEVCIVPCVVEAVERRFNRLTTAWPLMENNEFKLNYDLQVLYHSRVLNGVEITAYNKLIEECNQNCSQDECEYQISKTSLLAQHDSNAIEMWFLVPAAPTTRIEHRPSFALNDYIIYVTSCLGTWLGISVIGLNPFKLFEHYGNFNGRTSNSNNFREYGRLCRLESKYYRILQQQDLMTSNLSYVLSRVNAK